MTKVALFKQDGSNAGEIELNDSIFGRSLGVKRELDVPVKVQSVHHNGVVVVSSSDLLHVHTPTSCQRRFTVWH